MCDPISIGMAALGVGASLFGGNDDAPAATPPPAVAPARVASAARTPGADVRVGDAAKSDVASNTPQYDGFTTKRVSGKPLGGLGRGGLGL